MHFALTCAILLCLCCCLTFCLGSRRICNLLRRWHHCSSEPPNLDRGLIHLPHELIEKLHFMFLEIVQFEIDLLEAILAALRLCHLWIVPQPQRAWSYESLSLSFLFFSPYGIKLLLMDLDLIILFFLVLVCHERGFLLVLIHYLEYFLFELGLEHEQWPCVFGCLFLNVLNHIFIVRLNLKQFHAFFVFG